MVKTLKNTGKLLLLVAILGTIACGCKKNGYPNITEQGVGPFVLGSSIRNIPQKGEFYDTIIYKPLYEIGFVGGDNKWEWDEQEMAKNKKDVDDGFYYIVSTHFDCYVVQGIDTLMCVAANTEGNITCIKVLSEKIQFESGIHVGLTSDEMFSKYNALYICGNSMGGTDGGWTMMYFEVSGVSDKVSLVPKGRNKIKFGDEDGTINPDGYGMPIHGTETKYKGYEYYFMPQEDVKEDYLAYIWIGVAPNSWEQSWMDEAFNKYKYID